MPETRFDSLRRTTSLTIVFILMLSTRTVGAQAYDQQIDALRSLYLSSADDESQIDAAFAIIETLRQDSGDVPLIQAFDGALVVIQAKHAFWPRKKLAYVKRGLRELDAAIGQDPKNAEIRYLRLISCYYLPGLFGRKSSVEEDFVELAENVSEMRDVVSADFYSGLLHFVLEKGGLDEQSNQELRRQLEAVPTASHRSGR